MERPRSVMGPPATPASMHRRNASSIKSLSKLQGPPLTSLFLTNLKLLNLDLLPDWPQLSALSFTTTDARTRTRSVEWCLYQLFLIFDPHMTADKLRPFFPPLEHLQSVNLRAALYRCLNELKKNGTLGREATLRKTMLDDCSGEKFWDLCLAFSALVLRMVSVKGRAQYTTPVAQRYATASVLGSVERESLIPLAIAHKAALHKVLYTKARKRESFMRATKMMNGKEDELIERLDAIESQKPFVNTTEHAEELAAIEDALTHSSVADTAVVDAIINGDASRAGDVALLQSKSDFLEHLDDDPAEEDDRRDSGVLEDLVQKAKAQRARVSQWQALYDQLHDEHVKIKAQRAMPLPPPTDTIKYNKHHLLGVDDPQQVPRVPANPAPTPAYATHYDDVLSTMRDELRRAHTVRHAAHSPTKRTAPIRTPSITLDVVAGAPNIPAMASSARRSASPTLPLRIGLGRRVSSRSRAYTKPRVISQREPIPFKNETLSPLKTSPTSTGSTPVAVEYAEPQVQQLDAYKRDSQSSVEAPNVDSGIGLGVDWAESPVDLEPSSASHSRAPSTSQHSSLSERTRQSMAHPRAYDADPASPSSSSTAETTPVTEQQQSHGEALAARTRLSMAGFNMRLPVRPSGSISEPAPIVLSKRQSFRQSMYGANMLGAISTAGKSQDVNSPGRNITPREQLFDADAEASSVFRSRPKIATSPPLGSPMTGRNDEHTT